MSIINTVKKYYTNIPLWTTNMVAPFYYCIPQSKRYGQVFNNQIRKLREQDSFGIGEMQERVNNQFLSIVQHAYKNVPYYQRLFKEKDIPINSFKDISDISKIPFLTKELLVKYREELIATNINKESLQYITTSGSTGNPVGFYVDSDSTMKEWAYTIHLWSRIGYRSDSSRLLLRGKTFWAQKNQGRNWQYDALRRELSCNIFDFSEENLEQYCKAIEKYRPDFVHGYMSAVMILCKHIEKRVGSLRHRFKAILAVSENVLSSQREYVERILNARVFSFYGHSERLIMAGECEYSNEYHIEPLYGYAEIVDRNGNVIKDDSIGELVATGFCNKGMPLLRYKTGDMASWSQKNNCKCKRPHIRLKEVHGRWKQDVLVNCDNALISLTAINMHSNIFDKIIRYQFYQDTIGKIVMKILPNRNFGKDDEIKILKQLVEKTQGKIEFQIKLVDEIPIKANGKYSVVEQQLDVGMFNKGSVSGI